MHLNLTKTALICAAVVFIGLSALGQETKANGWKKATPAQMAEAEKALEQKLEGEVERKADNKKPAKVKSALELQCESYPDPKDQAVCFKAQSLEMARKASELNKKAKSSEPDSMRKVRKQEERAEKLQYEEQQDQLRKINNSQLTGCDADSVWVSRRAVQTTNWRVMTKVRITNMGTLPIDVESPLYGGLLVKNLCSGGSITLSFVLKWEDSDQVQIPLMALSRPPDGGVATEQFYANLNRWNIQYNRVTSQIWQVRLSRQYQTR